MTESHVVSVLKSKRAELAGELLQLERQTVERRTALAHLDATILMFDPEAKPSQIKPRRQVARNNWFGPNECIRAIYDVLRQAPEPMTTRDVAERIMAAKNIPREGRAPELIAKIVLAALHRAKDVERVVIGGTVVWRVIQFT